MPSQYSDKKILFITLHYLNGVGGGVFATRAFINAFAEIFNGNITLLYPETANHTIEGIDSRVKCIPIYDNAPKLTKGLKILTGHVHRYYSVLKEILRDSRYDLVVFDNSRVSFKMIDIVHAHGTKAITIHHNCEIEYNRDNSSTLIKPILLYWTKKYESQAVRKSDINLVLTPEDRNLLIEKYSLSSEISNNIKILGVFESEQYTLPKIKETSQSLSINNFIITGNLGARQSNNSLTKWLIEYYPSLKLIFPDAKLTIAGKNPSEDLNRLCKRLNIDLIASPISMSPLLEKADAYICPTSLGGGLKLRIMDGLKHGLPVITHSVSARGYHDFIEQGCVIPYDSVESFVAACEKIKKTPYNKEDIQKLYSNIFSFQSGCERLSELLNNKQDAIFSSTLNV